MISKNETYIMSPFMVFIFALSAGLAVANVYYAQPLLKLMAIEFGLPQSAAGMMVTTTQIGYGLGLFFIVPLGDVLNRRFLISGQLLLLVGALLMIGLAHQQVFLFGGFALLGLFAVVTQVLVAYAATLTAPSIRGKVVGLVTSGVVIGILLARTLSGIMADLGGWRSVYFLSAGLILLLAILLFRLLPAKDEEHVSTSYPRLLKSVFQLFIKERLLLIRSLIAMFLFASFSTLWTSLVLPLSAAPISFSPATIGLFGLVGVVGALGAAKAGKLADQGKGQRTTGIALGLLTLSWLFIAFTTSSLWALIIGIVLLDLAVQAVHVTSQTLIYTLQPEARSRIIAGYMIFYAIGSAMGAILSTAIFAWTGWIGVCILGAGFSALAFLLWYFTRNYKTGKD